MATTLQKTGNKSVDEIWKQALINTDNFISKNNLANLPDSETMTSCDRSVTTVPMHIYMFKSLIYNPEEGIVDKLVNVFSALHSMSASFFMIIRGHKGGENEYYIGCRSTRDNKATGEMLKRAFEGNFPGIGFNKLNEQSKKDLLDACFPLEYKNIALTSLSVSPDFRKEKREQRAEAYLQGIEKFIDSMKEQEYTAYFLAEPINRQDVLDKRETYEVLLTELSKCNKLSIAYSEGNSKTVSESLTDGVTDSVAKSITHSVSTNTTNSIGKTKGKNTGGAMMISRFSLAHGGNKTKTETNSTGSTEGDSEGNTRTEGRSSSNTKGSSDTTNTGTTLTVNVENRKIANLMERMEYELKKMDEADSYGMWDAAIYLLSEETSTTVIGANSIRSLALGDESGKAESFINTWDDSFDRYKDSKLDEIITFLHHGMHPVFNKKIESNGIIDDFYFTPAVMVGGNIMPSLFGLPMRSVPGISVIQMPEFGRNVVTNDIGLAGNRRINLGEVLYMGKKDGGKVELTVNSLSGHSFVCGAPGSGKSNTVYNILNELSSLNSRPEKDLDVLGNEYKGVNFLIIEPAKGEYKFEFSKMPRINIFSTRPNECRLLRINPFEFPYESMNVMEQIERLKNLVTACWSLTAAMPAILSDALERSYLESGWDLRNSIYVLPGKVKFPDFNTVLGILPKIINSSSYSADSKGDYTGALVTRVASMVKGMVGNIFCQDGGIDDRILFDENTIIDLSSVGSSEARALIMGVLVMKLENYRRKTAKAANCPLKHVTVLEEAHNLLPRVSTSQADDSSNLQGKSVEMISNAISEMRTYGEGFIIVDQSPHSVADVAISNTSTKIIMRLPGEEDLKVAGASVGLNEDQKNQIPMLAQGEAIVKQGNWINPVVASIKKSSNKYYGLKIPTFDYTDLKNVRAELIDKIIHLNDRTKSMKKLVSPDRNKILTFISGQTDIADHIKSLWIGEWNDFCDLDSDKRDSYFPKLILNLLMFKDGLKICYPSIEELPKKLGDPQGKYKEELNEWIEKIEKVLDAYVCADSDLKSKILYQIIRYCAEYKPSKLQHLCALSVLSMYKAGGIS